jgi:hypothetical protein
VLAVVGVKMLGFRVVGAPGFEPGTSCSQSKRAAGLRYAPMLSLNYTVKYRVATFGLSPFDLMTVLLIQMEYGSNVSLLVA